MPGNQNPRDGGKNITRTCFLNTKIIFCFACCIYLCSVMNVEKKNPEKNDLHTVTHIDVDLLKNANFIGRVQNKNLFINN